MLTWRLGPTENGPARLVAHAFAEQAAQYISQHSAAAVRWFHGGSWQGHAWAALALNGEPSELARARSQLSNLSDNLNDISITAQRRAEALRMGATETAALALLQRDESLTPTPAATNLSSEPHSVFLTR